MKVQAVLKMFLLWMNEGNENSGNHGHVGRKGEVGGSSSDGTVAETGRSGKVAYKGAGYEGLSDEEIVASISSKGLMLGGKWDDNPPSVYLTYNPDEAHNYGNMFAGGEVGSRYAIISFVVPNDYSLIPDEAEIEKGSLAFRVEKPIPPQSIRTINIWEVTKDRNQPKFVSYNTVNQNEKLAYHVIPIDRK